MQGGITPSPPQDASIVQQTIAEATRQPVPTKQELSAEAYFAQGYALHDDSEKEIAYYTEAIRLNPQYATAYYGRGGARGEQGDWVGAIADFNQYRSIYQSL